MTPVEETYTYKYRDAEVCVHCDYNDQGRRNPFQWSILLLKAPYDGMELDCGFSASKNSIVTFAQGLSYKIDAFWEKEEDHQSESDMFDPHDWEHGDDV